jgi:hypothetical protein
MCSSVWPPHDPEAHSASLIIDIAPATGQYQEHPCHYPWYFYHAKWNLHKINNLSAGKNVMKSSARKDKRHRGRKVMYVVAVVVEGKAKIQNLGECTSCFALPSSPGVISSFRVALCHQIVNIHEYEEGAKRRQQTDIQCQQQAFTQNAQALLRAYTLHRSPTARPNHVSNPGFRPPRRTLVAPYRYPPSCAPR